MARGLQPRLSSTVVALVFAYLTGQFLHAWVSEAYPHTKNGRPPSTVLLDNDDPTFPPSLRRELIRRFDADFGVNVSDPHVSDLVRNERRQRAFFSARQR